MTEGLRIYHNNRRYVLDRVSIKTLSDEELDNLKWLVNYEQVRRMKEGIDALGKLVRPEKSNDT